MIVQVSHENCDTFHEISEEGLRQIRDLPLSERKAAFLAAASDASVHSTSQVAASLVLDGENDAESWDELAEELGWTEVRAAAP